MKARVHIPIVLSWCRLLAVIPLHFLAMAGQTKLLALGLVLAGLTDILDGFLARRWGCVSRFGSKLDSAADNVLGSAVMAWVFVLCPNAPEHIGLACYIVLATAAPGVIGWLIHKRFVAMHTYSARLAATCAYGIFCCVLMGDLTFGPVQRMLLTSVVTLKAMDELLIVLLADDEAVDQERSIFTYWSVGRSAASLPRRDCDESRVA